MGAPAELPRQPRNDAGDHFQTVFDNAPQGMTLADEQGIYLRVNTSFARLLGLPRAQVVGQSFARFTATDVKDDSQTIDDLIARQGGSSIREKAYRRADGTTFPALVNTSLIRATESDRWLILDQVESLAERRAAEATLLDVQSTVDAIITVSGTGRIASWNRGAERMLGYPASSMLGQTPERLFGAQLDDDDRSWIDRMSGQSTQSRLGVTTEVEVFRADGQPLLVEVSLSCWEQHGSTRYTAVLRDITARRRTEGLFGLVAQAARTSNEAGSLVDAAPDIIEAICFCLDWTAGHAWSQDDALASWHVSDHPHPTGEDCALLVLAATGSRPDAGQLPVDPETRVALDHAGLAGSDVESALVSCDIGSALSVPVLAGTDAGGVLVLYQPSRAPAPDPECIAAIEQIGLILGRVVERERRTSLTRHQAAHDPLTDLANRRTLLEHIEATQSGLADGRMTGKHALLLFDLDRFKLINDSLGHVAGDAILQEVAARLTSSTRPGDLTARLGGDEFVVLTHDHPDDESILAHAQDLHIALTCTLEVAKHPVSLRTSIGVCPLVPRSAPTPREAEAALRDADAALRLAKRRGKGRLEVFDAALRDDAAQWLRDQTELEGAITTGQLTIQYQPIIDLESAEPAGAEALVRWIRPGHGMVFPDAFIPLAEETGLIIELGRWVLRRACSAAAQWSTAVPALADAAVSINVSSRQLTHADFLADVGAALDDAGLPARRLILEVTESVLIEESDSIVEILSRLRARGIRIALDDFGKGYSSLSYLQRLPLDILKIDKSFVAPIQGPDDGTALSEVVLKLAQALNLQIVAEGVSSTEQVIALRKMGCALAQGFGLAAPAFADDLQSACEGATQVAAAT